MAVHGPPENEELKARQFRVLCPCCDAGNHVLVDYDPRRNHSEEYGVCWNCREIVHKETCFLVWTGKDAAAIERHAQKAARLRRAL